MIGACCPKCRGELGDTWQCGGCGARYPTIDGIPVLVVDPDLDVIDVRESAGALPTYDGSAMGIRWVDEALARGDRILELGAGLDLLRAPNVVTSDAFVYGTESMDLVADAHRLPFADASFDFVFSLAVFEHLHSPWIAAQEIARVLRPGGGVYTLCAFMQPLHGYPDHYFNTTESGLRRLFSDEFEVVEVGPSRHCPQNQALVTLHRMREMAAGLVGDASASRPARWRARLLAVALTRSAREYARLAETMSRTPDGYDAWRQIAPAVEVYATRR